MALQPEERAVEIIAEMDALIATCETQLQETKDLFERAGIDAASLNATIAQLPADKRREMEEAVAADLRAVEEDVARAKLDADHAPRTAPRKRPMRTMV